MAVAWLAARSCPTVLNELREWQIELRFRAGEKGWRGGLDREQPPTTETLMPESNKVSPPTHKHKIQTHRRFEVSNNKESMLAVSASPCADRAVSSPRGTRWNLFSTQSSYPFA